MIEIDFQNLQELNRIKFHKKEFNRSKIYILKKLLKGIKDCVSVPFCGRCASCLKWYKSDPENRFGYYCTTGACGGISSVIKKCFFEYKSAKKYFLKMIEDKERDF